MWSTSDPVSRVGASIAIILIAAKLGGDIATRLRAAVVLGEFVAGILLGGPPFTFIEGLRTDASDAPDAG